MPWVVNKQAIAKELPGCGGSYALFLQLSGNTIIHLPRFGLVEFPAGVYIYSGSAKGSGGLKGRVARHINQIKRKHWHLDWLRPHTEVIGVFYTMNSGQHECVWSNSLSEQANGRVIISGFGSSDCKLGCPSHLVWFERGIDVRRLLSYLV